jgi:hypothetical protein
MNPLRLSVALVLVLGLGLVASPVWAGRCRIANTTKVSFTIESGNVSNQRVGAHTSTTIEAGKIIGKSDDGKGVGGSCKDGDKVKIVEEQGVYLLLPE